MNDRVAHRGPDGEGSFVDEHAGIALGHRRLAIVDLSEAGAQPMTSRDGRWVVTFNGEVYDHRQLRRELESTGSRFRGHSDTEVLLEAIATRGLLEALSSVNAMFALGAWDRHRGELHLARDPMGEKPLYVALTADGVAFASELLALQSTPGIDVGIDHEAVARYLSLGYVPAPATILRGVRKLRAGELQTHRSSGGSTTRWLRAEPPERDDARSTDAVLEELELLLDDAVALRLQADVPVGVFLSGGVDSTLVASSAVRSATDVRTFTIGFPGTDNDEADRAAAVASHLGTDHTTMTVSPADALALVGRLPTMYGEPFADPSAIPTHLLATLARSDVTVGLSGDGGDESFAGYNRLAIGARTWPRIAQLPRPVRRSLAALLPVHAGATALARLRVDLPNAEDKLGKLQRLLRCDDDREALDSLVCVWPPGVLSPRLGTTTPSQHSVIDLLLDHDQNCTLPEQMLVKVDRATMAVGLEVRVPLVDPRIVSLAARQPVSRHLGTRKGKALLWAVLERRVPRALVDRPKLGFDPPLADWLRGPLKPWAGQLLEPTALEAFGIDALTVGRHWREHQSGRHNWDYRLWAVLMLMSWSEQLQQGPPARTPA
jgi:asparagine synthase (glutamine-hydrolysing)